MATLIVVTSPDDVEGFVSLARRVVRASVFPTLAVYKGDTHVTAGEFDAIEGVSWLEQLDLEHNFEESLERLAINRVVLQVDECAYADDQCSLLLHQVRECRQVETVLLDRGNLSSSNTPERAIVPAASPDPRLAVRLSHQIVGDDGWTVVVAAHACSTDDRDQAALDMMELLQGEELQPQQRVSTTLVPTPGQTDAVREMLTEHDILVLGQATFADLKTYRTGSTESGDLPMPAGTAIAAICSPDASRRTSRLAFWRRGGVTRRSGNRGRRTRTRVAGQAGKRVSADLLAVLAGTTLLVLLGIVLKMNLMTAAGLLILLSYVLIPGGSRLSATNPVGGRVSAGKR